MLNSNKKFILYTMLVLAVGSVIALTGLFKISGYIIAPKQKIIDKIEVSSDSEEFTFENLAVAQFNLQCIGTKCYIENIKISDRNLTIIPIKIDIYKAETNYTPIITVNLRSLQIDLGAPILIALGKYGKGTYELEDIVKTIFNTDVNIDFRGYDFKVITFTICYPEESSCSLAYNDIGSAFDHETYYVMLLAKPPYENRIWKLEIEII